MGNPFADPNFGAELNPFSDPEFGKEPERNAIQEVGLGLKRGTIGFLPKMAGQAVQWATDKGGTAYEAGKSIADRAQARLDRPENQLSPEKHNVVTNALASGAEMLPSSVVPPLAIGAGLATLPVSGPVGLGIAAVAGAVPMGMAQAQETSERVKAAGGTDEAARIAGWKTGGIETAGETVGTYLGGKLLGIGGKALSRTAGKTIGNTIGNAVDTRLWTPYAQQLLKTAIGETATEMGQGYSQAVVEKNAGVGTDPWQQTKDVIAPTLGMTALLAPFGLAGHYRNTKKAEAIDRLLLDPAAAPAEARLAVVDMLHRDAKANKVEDADAWRVGAMADIANNAPIRREVGDLAPLNEPMSQPGDPGITELDRKISNLETTAKASPVAAKNLEALKAQRAEMAPPLTDLEQDLFEQSIDVEDQAATRTRKNAFENMKRAEEERPWLEQEQAALAYNRQANAPLTEQEVLDKTRNADMDRLVQEYQDGDLPTGKGTGWAYSQKASEPGDKMDPEFIPAIAKMEAELKGGEVGGLTNNGRAGNEQEITGRFPGTNPEWFKRKTVEAFDKKNGTSFANSIDTPTVLIAISKVRKGEKLSGRQEKAWEYLKTQAKEMGKKDPELAQGAQVDKMQADGLDPVFSNMPAGDLTHGDEIEVGPGSIAPADRYKVKGWEDGQIVLQDGVEVKVDPWDTLNIEGRKATGKELEDIDVPFGGKRPASQGEGGIVPAPVVSPGEGGGTPLSKAAILEAKAKAKKAANAPPDLSTQNDKPADKQTDIPGKGAGSALPDTTPDAEMSADMPDNFGPVMGYDWPGRDKAATMPRDSILLHTGTRPNGKQWHIAFVSEGDGKATRIPIGPDKTKFSRAEIMAQVEKDRQRSSETEIRIAAAKSGNLKAIEEKGIRVGAEWKGAEAYVRGKGKVTYDRAKVISIDQENGYVTIEVYRRGMRRPDRFEVDPESRFFENYTKPERPVFGETKTNPAENKTESAAKASAGAALPFAQKETPNAQTDKMVSATPMAEKDTPADQEGREGLAGGVPAETAGGVKEPWQQTKAEYVDGHYRSPGMHREGVRLALERGEAVPAEVLADYPGLTPQAVIKAQPREESAQVNKTPKTYTGAPGDVKKTGENDNMDRAGGAIHATIDRTYQAQVDRIKATSGRVPSVEALHSYADYRHGTSGQGGTVMDLTNDLSVMPEDEYRKWGQTGTPETARPALPEGVSASVVSRLEDEAADAQAAFDRQQDSSGSIQALQKELDALLAKRERIREKQMARFHNGSATRARTTTGNADADRVNEQIISLREQIKQASNKETTPKQEEAAPVGPPAGLQSNKPASEMTAAELLRAAADKMENKDKPTNKTAPTSRSKPRGIVDFGDRIIGPSGAKLESYQWQYRMESDIDKTGEEVERRVSDWDQAEVNNETGRLVVHQFAVTTKDGKSHLASLETALELLGYTEKSIGGKAIGSLAAIVKTRARNMMELDGLIQEQALADEWEKDFKTAQKAVDRSKMPEMTTEDLGGRVEFKRGDGGAEIGFAAVAKRWLADPVKMKELGDKTAKLWVDSEAEKAAGQAPEGRAWQRDEKIASLKRRIKAADAKIDAFSQGTADKMDAADKPATDTLEAATDKPANVPTGTDNQGMTEEQAQEEGRTQAEREDATAKTDLDFHNETMARIHAGEATLAEYKAGFRRVVGSKEELTAELSGMTKDQLLDRMGGFRNKSDKKDFLVRMAYDDMFTDFWIEPGMFSYGMDGPLPAMQKAVGSATESTLAAHAEKVKANRAERKAMAAQMIEAVKDPKTLEDFHTFIRAKKAEGKTFAEARREMSPEQQVTFDELTALKSRKERGARKEEGRTQVRTAGATTGAEIIATKHTRDGYDLFVVQAEERVEREVYNEWNAAAKKMGGWYSKFRGNGAIPGFQFKTREAAEAFQKYVSKGDTEAVKEQAQARRDAYADDRSQTAVERLTEMADKLEERADASLNQDRKANTSRRAAQAARAESAANSDKALAKTMRNIAKAIESGTAQFLDRVRQKSQVEMLRAFTSRALYAEQREKYPEYRDYEQHKGGSPTASAASFVEFPQYTAYRSDLARLGRELEGIEGTKKIGAAVLKVANDISDAYLTFAKENLHKVSTFSKKDGSAAVFKTRAEAEGSIQVSGHKGNAIVVAFKRGQNMIIMSPSLARERGVWEGDDDKRITITNEAGAEIVAKVKAMGRRVSMPYIFENVRDEQARLAGMGIETPAELRAAVREFIALREAPKAPDKVKELERAMVGRVKDGLDFFPTPEGVAQDMIEAAGIEPGMTVLEPSAGMGHIAEKIREAGVDPDVVEMSGKRRELLEAKGFNVVGQDFMDTAEQYDRIIMNPPFSDRRDAEHVQHAYSLLKPDGRLVAIMGEGVFFGQDKKAQAFREWLDSVNGTAEKLEEGTFLDPSLPVNTGANARLVVVDKQSKRDALYSKISRSRSELINVGSFASQLEKYVDGSMTASTPLSVGATPEVLRLLGADNLPVVINQKTVDKILHEKHGLSVDMLKHLPEQLAKPIMVFDSATEPGGLVVMTELQHEGKTVVAAIHLNAGQQHHEVNRISSVYGKDSDGIFGKWIARGLLRYQDKEKSRRWFQSRGLQLPKEEANNGLARKNILTEDDLVKYSKGESATGTTISQVETELRAFLKKGYDRLTALGKLKIVQTEAELPGGENVLNSVGKKGTFSDPHDFAKDEFFAKYFFSERTPPKTSELAKWLRDHREDFVTLYHGTAAINKIREQGIKPTTTNRRNSYQSTSGYSYVSVYPGMAEAFGRYAGLNRGPDENGNKIAVYPVMIQIKNLRPDIDQLNNQRSVGKDVGNSLAESLLVGSGARVRGKIENNAISSPVILYSKDGSIAGTYDPKTKQITLVADTIKSGDARYVMLHEGLHKLMNEDALFVKNRDAILEQFKQMKRYDYRVQDAYRRVPADTASSEVDHEALAYFIEEKKNHTTSLFKKIIANIRMWLMRMGIPMKNLTPDDLVALFTQGVKSMANQATREETSRVGEMVPALYSKEQIIEAAKAIYSKLEQVAKINFLGMKAQGVVNNLLKHGVKKVEIEAVGLNEWLAAKKPTDKVTQTELLDFIKANTVELEDVVLGGESLAYHPAGTLQEPGYIQDEDQGHGQDAHNEDEWRGIYENEGFNQDEIDDKIGDLIDVGGERNPNGDQDEGATHFSKYTEPGAVEGSYREMFVTAPSKQQAAPKYKNGEEYYKDGQYARDYADIGIPWDKLNSYQRKVVEEAYREADSAYMEQERGKWQDGHSQYSEVKNPIVRIRFNEVNADGKRLLRIEEMQGPNPDNQAKMPKHLRENIYQLGVKRVLAYAKENGFDGVALATKPGMSAGATQNDRYSLAHELDRLDVKRRTDGTYLINGVKKGNSGVIQKDLAESKLESAVGKDVAAKIIENPSANQTYEGADLTVSSAGIMQLYDTTLPAMLEAYGKGKMVDVVSVAEDDATPPATVPSGVERRSMGWSIVYPGEDEDSNETYWGAWSKKEDAEKAFARVRADKYALVQTTSTPYLPLENAPASYPMFSKIASLENLEEVAKTMGSITVKKRSKTDSTFIDRIFSTPEYYFKKFAAAGRVLQAALLRRDVRFTKEQEILGKEFVGFVQALRKNNREAYDEANDYLIDHDQTGEGFSLKEEDETWKVIGPDGKMVSRHDTEQEAVAAMVEAEAVQLAKNGYSADAIQAVRLARELTNRGFDVMAADMRKIIEEAKKAGLPNPLIGDGTIDESGRYGIYGAHSKKPIELFATEQQANAALDRAAQAISYVVQIKGGGERSFMSEIKANAWAKKHSGTVNGRKTFDGLTVRMRTDVEMRPLTVQQALAQMGDMRGTYFPRIRKPGEYVLIAKKDGENPIRKSFDLPMVGDDKPKLQKFIGGGPKWASVPMAREARRLKARGYDVTMGYDESPVDDVFSGTNLTTAIDAILQDSMAVIDKNSQGDIKAGQQINQLITMQVADIFKARGYLSSRLKRMSGDVVWEGYETDMGKALTQYGKGIAAGTAKRDTAMAMVLAFSGRDYSWDDYKQEVDKPVWSDYQEIVEQRRIDPRRQKNLFVDVRAFMIDVLRNDEKTDRIIGTMKGLAVLKFLAFRVSSAAVNATNMVTGVPATLSGHVGISLGKAGGHIGKAVSAYAKYRTGKGEMSEADRAIFQEITDRGWDDAQFNQEAARELRGELGEAWNKIMTTGMFMFGAVEKANRATTIFAAYKAVQEKSPGMSPEQIWTKAKEVSDRAHGVYGKETRPAWTRGGDFNRLLALPYTFAKFSHNYMLNMIDLGYNKKEYQAAAYLLLSPAILSGAGATLATPILMGLASALGIGGDDPEEEYYKWAEKTFGTDAFARHGLAGLAGINLKGSLQIHNPMPTKLSEVFGAPGAIVTDTWKAIEHFGRGELGKGVEALLPTAFGSFSKATREATEGITTSNYGQVFYGDEPLKADNLDAALRFFSFNPARLSGIREKQWNEKEVAAKYQERKTEIYAKIKRLHIQGKGITPEVNKEIVRFNELVRGSGRSDIKQITPKSIRRVLILNNRASKFERNRGVENS